jgi:hypothetical protein
MVIRQLGTPSATFEQGGILTYHLAHRPEYSGYYVVTREQSNSWPGDGYYKSVYRAHGAWNEYSLVLLFDSRALLQKYSLVEVYKKYDDS